MNGSSLNIKSVGITAIIIILLLEYAVMPWLDWVSVTQESIISTENKLIKQNRLIKKAEHLELQKYDLETDFKSKIANLSIVKKNQDSAIIWLKEVDKQLAKYDLTINNKAPLREIQINENFAVFVGKINVTGNYSEVLSLLEKLENFDEGNRVRQLRLYSDRATMDKVRADIELLKVFKRS